MANNSIMVFRNTISRRIARERIPLKGRLLISKNSLYGWVALEEMIFPARGLGKGLITIVDDRSGVPISPYYKPVVEDTDKAEISKQAYNLAKGSQDFETHKQFQSDMLVFGILGLIAGIIIIALLNRGGG